MHARGGRGSGHRRQGEAENRKEREQPPEGEPGRHESTMPVFRVVRKVDGRQAAPSHGGKVKGSGRRDRIGGPRTVRRGRQYP
ncbi:hypothetical protein MOX02_14410 [Methylobacterium oxalidis]|uniref:Uncharacterized protein n=1 Tax=Methylobacterium oxalidis TaxID=944322 RepID=A0A512J0H1_9HYPH|nr:hypothetical protein MOX02_14410 [Methylobacterium oxalidis]GLS63392.1 hypothetical protein GCM10007888_17730 [Methylobacterium oxalidis]